MNKYLKVTNNKNLITVALFCLLFLTQFLQAREKTKDNFITIENKSKFNYVDKVVALPWSLVKENYPLLETNNFKITESISKKETMYQLEYSGNKEIQYLLVQVSLKPGAIIKLKLENGKHILFNTKTFARYVPERLDDFAWENDKIAFRMYGKALELAPKGNAFGIDVWVKRTNRMIINERYKRGEYHVDHGDGMDYYHVGFTLGAGNIAPYEKDSIWYSKNYSQWKILDNGPLRTTFQLDFDSWDVAGRKMTATKIVSLDAGEQLNKVSVQYNYEATEDLSVVVGIIKRPETGTILLNEKSGIMAYWEPKLGNNGTTGVGVIIPSVVKEMQVKNGQILAISKAIKNKPFIYYTGAAWDKGGDFTSKELWFEYLNIKQQQLADDGLLIRFIN